MKFEILLGPEDGKIIEDKIIKMKIGRGVGNDLPLSYARMVSGNHAEVQKEGDRYYLVDVESRHGTRILKKNGTEIKIHKGNRQPPFPGETIQIEPGDIFILGDSLWLKFLGD